MGLDLLNLNEMKRKKIFSTDSIVSFCLDVLFLNKSKGNIRGRNE